MWFRKETWAKRKFEKKGTQEGPSIKRKNK
jgi:hypothetical protein